MIPSSIRSRVAYAVFLLWIIATGFLINSPYHFQVLILIGLNTILTLGLNMLMGYAGQISLGHAAFFGLGAYTTAVLTGTYHASLWVSLPCAILIAVLVALMVGVPTLKLSGYYLGMGTLGFGMIVYIIFREWASVTGGASGLAGIPPLTTGSIVFQSDNRNAFWLVWMIVLILIVVCRRLMDSRIGRALRAIHDSEHAAKAVGVHTANLKLQIFIFSAGTAGLAGFLYAHLIGFISPSTFDFITSVRLVTMVVIGGMASIWGALLGASLLTLLPDWLHTFADFEMVVYGLILMIVMIVMPQGLTRGILDIYERSQSKISDR